MITCAAPTSVLPASAPTLSGNPGPAATTDGERRFYASSSYAILSQRFTSSSISASFVTGMRCVMRSFLAKPPVSISRFGVFIFPRARPKSMRLRGRFDLREHMIAVQRNNCLARAGFHILAQLQAERQQFIVEGAQAGLWTGEHLLDILFRCL